ncbi:MAG: J domain-containing protein [Ruminococcus sp.]|nr:J domain-containing protein [Ruminococcus sp.]MCM1478848.1 J domain-containing protein [Muribaculaceae bacterium]
MNDPYRILGVMPSASDEEIKTAYKSLIRQYSGDSGKIAEIDEAYDAIMDMRRGSFEQAAGGLAEVRRQIQNGNYGGADAMLESMPERNAEWYFLKGSVCYGKGWLNEAYANFGKACDLEPYNQEYASALRHMSESKNGYMRGDPNGGFDGDRSFGCGVCDICNGLICADCCCECMGGDCIPCC